MQGSILSIPPMLQRRAERKLTGQAIRDLGLNRYDLVIATKVRGAMGEGPNDSGLSRKHILQQIDESLSRLNVDYIDLYQIHGFDPLTPLEETLETLDSLVKSGKVRYIGCSNLAAWQIMKALGISAQQHYPDCLVAGLLYHCRT